MKLESGKELRFNNIRKFGRLYLIDNGHPEQAGGLAKLGPEPLSEDFTEKDFKKLFKGRHGVIKSLLMNQKFIAGLGNIYADEILYRAGIDPERKADKISEQEQVELYHIMREILRAGIKFGGTSFSDYVNGLGEKGSFQEELLVYQQSGQACERCSEEIIKKKVGGRSSYYCPGCQK